MNKGNLLGLTRFLISTPKLSKKFKMNKLEKQIFDLACSINPQAIYSMGLEQFAEEIMILSTQNIDLELRKISRLKKKCRNKDSLARKYLDSIETSLLMDEPGAGIAPVIDTISTHLIKEGFNAVRLKKIINKLDQSLKAWITHLEKRNFSIPVKILAQYQVLGAYEILDLITRESRDEDLSAAAMRLSETVDQFRRKFFVSGFTDGEFSEVVNIMRSQGADLERQDFYPRALRSGFDYRENPRELERKSLRWISQELPKLKSVSRTLSKILQCDKNVESVDSHLRSGKGVSGKEVLQATIKMRPIVQKMVAESIVGMNPKYNAQVIETPSFLTPIIPTGAAQGLDGLTENPIQLFYITTDPKRAPPGGFADLVNLLVHEEYGHCLHFSNTAEQFAAKASIIEILPSLHTGSTSEGLAFQREFEFLDRIQKISRKPESSLTAAEKEFVRLTDDYGGFSQFLLELEFVTYKQRIIRFLRVLGDARINSGKQNLLDFLDWAKKKTGISQRTMYYQLFPAHEGMFPGYATCYAVVGQDIKAIQRYIKSDTEKMVKFNAYACSVGYPARSIYTKRLKEYALRLARR